MTSDSRRGVTRYAWLPASARRLCATVANVESIRERPNYVQILFTKVGLELFFLFPFLRKDQ